MFSLAGFHVFPHRVSCFPIRTGFHVFPFGVAGMETNMSTSFLRISSARAQIHASRLLGPSYVFVGLIPCESQAGSNKYQAPLQIHACEVLDLYPAAVH